jgi:hypothetical protein
VADGEETICNFQLSPLTFGVIRGTVTDLDTGDPIDGAYIYISNGNYWFHLQTDQSGQYYVQVPADGGYIVQVSKDDLGYRRASVEGIEVWVDQETVADFQLELIKYGTISGAVTDAETSDPIEGVWMVLYWVDLNQGFYYIESTLTDARGVTR